MSLIDEMTEIFIIMNKSKLPDGEGGYITTWTDGATIKAALTLDASTLAKIAEAQGVSNTYTVTTRKDVLLDFHDVIKRVSDGATFRITSYSTDKKSPAASTLNMAQASAEKWSLT